MIDVSGINKVVLMYYLLGGRLPLEVIKITLGVSSRFTIQFHEHDIPVRINFDLSTDQFDATSYDEVFGSGSAAKIIESIKENNTLEGLLKRAGINPNIPPSSAN